MHQHSVIATLFTRHLTNISRPRVFFTEHHVGKPDLLKKTAGFGVRPGLKTISLASYLTSLSYRGFVDKMDITLSISQSDDKH